MISLIRKITRNWKLKTLAVILTVLLWVVVSSEQVTSQWLSVPLRVQVTDPSYRLAGDDLPRQVEVRFSGSGRDLVSLVLSAPPLLLTIPQVEESVENRILDPRMVQIPLQMAVSALDVRPSSLRVEYVRIVTATFPVRPQISNRLGTDWAIIDMFVTDPARVAVTGPLQRLAGITGIPTMPVVLGPNDTIIDRTIPLDTVLLRGVELSTASVRLRGRAERIVERTLAGVGVDLGPGFDVAPGVVDVTLRGARSIVGAVRPDSLRVILSVSELPERIPPEGLVVPLGIEGLPARVEARLSPGEVRLFPEAGLQDAVGAGSAGSVDVPSANAPPAR